MSKKNKQKVEHRPKIQIESFHKEVHETIRLGDLLKEVTDLGLNPSEIDIDLYWTDYECAHILVSSSREETDSEYQARICLEDENERKYQEMLVKQAQKRKEKAAKEAQIKKLQDEVDRLRAQLKV